MFPFDEPGPTAFYLVLYLGTMLLHVVPMNYVLAGSGLLAWLAGWEAFTKRTATDHAPLAAVLRDWLPLALSIAITAGVAPLLFLQILYKEPFYTANLLLLHRWMIIVPVLIVAFYLLYVQKMKRVAEGAAWGRLALAAGVLACFAFVAWTWTENHLLSLQDQATWSEQYASGRSFYGNAEIAPRLALWLSGAVVNLALVLAWQLRASKPDDPSATAKRLARLAIVGITLAALAALAYVASLPAEVRGVLLGRGMPYLVTAVAGLGATAWGWRSIAARGAFGSISLTLVTSGALLTTLGVTALRELRRLTEIDLSQHYATHAQATEVGGLGLFVFFLVANTAAIGWVLVLVRRRSPA